MQNSTMTMISKSTMLASKASTEVDNGNNVLGYVLVDTAKAFPTLHRKNLKERVNSFEDEVSTSASGSEDGANAPSSDDDLSPKGSRGPQKMQNWMMAQGIGLAAGLLLATGFWEFACALVAAGVYQYLQKRNEPSAPAKRSFQRVRTPAAKSEGVAAKKPVRAHPLGTAAKQGSPAQSSQLPFAPHPSMATSEPAAAPAARPQRAPFPKQQKLITLGVKPTPSPADTRGSVDDLLKMMAAPSKPMLATSAVRKPCGIVAQPSKQSPYTKMQPQADSAQTKKAEEPVKVYTVSGFRKELSGILKELSGHRNAATAVGQVRAQCVPVDRQASEFSDILTRAMEESNGPLRRTYVAFAAGIAAGGDHSAFVNDECAKGVDAFFAEVYEELCSEVPRLEKIVECELVPTLRAVFSADVLKKALPRSIK